MMKEGNDSARKMLSPDKRKELSEWLELQSLHINKIHRDCTDAVVVAKILKKIYPRMIDLYNYPERNTIKLKLANWTTLNVKTLSKLGLPQKPIALHKYVNADRDAIELLLYNIMCLEKSKLKKPIETIENDCYDDNYEYTEKDTVVVNINKQIDDEIVKEPKKMINYAAYAQAMHKFKNFSSNLSVAELRIKELEDSLKKKAAEIDQLCNQLALQTVITMETKSECAEEPEACEITENFEEPTSESIENSLEVA